MLKLLLLRRPDYSLFLEYIREKENILHSKKDCILVSDEIDNNEIFCPLNIASTFFKSIDSDK